MKKRDKTRMIFYTGWLSMFGLIVKMEIPYMYMPDYGGHNLQRFVARSHSSSAFTLGLLMNFDWNVGLIFQPGVPIWDLIESLLPLIKLVGGNSWYYVATAQEVTDNGSLNFPNPNLGTTNFAIISMEWSHRFPPKFIEKMLFPTKRDTIAW